MEKLECSKMPALHRALYVWICESFQRTLVFPSFREIIGAGFAKSTGHVSPLMEKLVTWGYLEAITVGKRSTFRITGAKAILPRDYYRAKGQVIYEAEDLQRAGHSDRA